MKKTLVFIVLVAWLLNCAPTLPQYKYHQYKGIYPIVISERVGETIDAEEREQLDLFTEIGEFKEARFYAIKGGGYVIEIATEDDNLVAINRDQDAVMIVRDYVNNYEAISIDHAAFEKKWGVLDYDTLGIPITENEVRLAIKQSRGSAVRGCIAGCGCFSLLGLAIGAGMASGASGAPDAPLAAIGLLICFAAGSAIGLVAGSIIYVTTYKKNTESVLGAIKEARKPRIVE